MEPIRAIHNNLGTQLVANTANRGAIRGLPDDAVIETSCVIDLKRVHTLVGNACITQPLLQKMLEVNKPIYHCLINNTREQYLVRQDWLPILASGLQLEQPKG